MIRLTQLSLNLNAPELRSVVEHNGIVRHISLRWIPANNAKVSPALPVHWFERVKNEADEQGAPKKNPLMR